MNDTFYYDCHVECPHCSSTKTEIDEFKVFFDQSAATIPMYCHTCGTTWDAVYEFKCNVDVDVPDYLKTKEEV